MLRSKNSGPFLITLDVFFDDLATYRRVVESGVLCRQTIKKCYQLSDEKCGYLLF
jgi:hypothetical protein